MASIRREILINADADTIWDAMRDVGALHTRLVPGFVTNTRMESPGVRLVTFGTGQTFRELIVDICDADRRVVWSVRDPMFTHHNGSAQVFPDGTEGSARSRFVWIADFLPDERRDQSAAMMDEGLRVLKATMEGAGG